MTPADQREPLVEGPAVPLEAGGRDAAGDPARSPVAIFSAHSRLLPNGATSRYSVRSFHSPAGPVDRDGHIAGHHSTSRSGQPDGVEAVFILHCLSPDARGHSRQERRGPLKRIPGRTAARFPRAASGCRGRSAGSLTQRRPLWRGSRESTASSIRQTTGCRQTLKRDSPGGPPGQRRQCGNNGLTNTSRHPDSLISGYFHPIDKETDSPGRIPCVRYCMPSCPRLR